jgi:hypothetical protein
MEGVVVAVTVVLCIWLLVASGLQRGEAEFTLPEPLPQAPSTVSSELNGTGLEANPVPLPGPEIAPVRSSVEPR